MAKEEWTESEDQLRELRKYWDMRIKEFEAQVYPVFYAQGYSKNTALLAYMIDELDTSIVIATSARKILGEES